MMIDPDDLTIEPNDDDVCDEWWSTEEPTDDTDDFEVPDDVETHQL